MFSLSIFTPLSCDNTWIDDDVILYNLDYIKIGSNCSISRRSFLCTGSHDITKETFDLITKPIVVEDSVWIQADCFIAQGVTIGEGSIVGARKNVFKNVPRESKVYLTWIRQVMPKGIEIKGFFVQKN